MQMANGSAIEWTSMSLLKATPSAVAMAQQCSVGKAAICNTILYKKTKINLKFDPKYFNFNLKCVAKSLKIATIDCSTTLLQRELSTILFHIISYHTCRLAFLA